MSKEIIKEIEGKFFGPLIFPENYKDSDECYQKIYLRTAESREGNEDIIIGITETISSYKVTADIFSVFSEKDFIENRKNPENPCKNQICETSPYGLFLNGIKVKILLFNGSVIAFGTEKAFFHISERKVIYDIETLKRKLMENYAVSLLSNLNYNYNQILGLGEYIDYNIMNSLKGIGNVINEVEEYLNLES